MVLQRLSRFHRCARQLVCVIFFNTILGATLRSCMESIISTLLTLTYSTYPRILSCFSPPCYVEQRRKDVQQQLETLNEQLRSQIESIVDMCEECIREAEEALIHNENAPKPDDDKASSDASKVFDHGMHARAHANSYNKCARCAYESPTYTAHTRTHAHMGHTGVARCSIKIAG